MTSAQSYKIATDVNDIFKKAGVLSEGEVYELLEIAECLRNLENSAAMTLSREHQRTFDRKE